MINIHKYQLAFYIKCNPQGTLLECINCNIKKFLDIFLSEEIELPKENYYDKTPNIKIHYNCYFDKLKNRLYIHNAFLDKFINNLKYLNIQYKIKIHRYIKPKNISINLNNGIKDKDNQKEPVKWILSYKKSIICLPLQTGDGKTYISIKYVAVKKLKSLIIVPAHLQTQWINSFKKFTNLDESRIYIIQGKDTLHKLQPEYHKRDKYDIYISTIQSLSGYITDRTSLYKDCLSLNKLLEYLRIGIKIIDEAHLNFKQTLSVDLLSNIKHNIYLSATFYRTDKRSNQIFQTIFKDDYKYKTKDYKRYVNISEVIYHGINGIMRNEYMSHKGYSEIKYEKYLYKKKILFKYFVTNILFPILDNNYLQIKNDNEKCLIIVKLKLFGQHLLSYLLTNYKIELEDLKIGVYFSEHTKDYRDGLDIIISTFQSSGTGSDIPNLRTVLLIDNFKAKSQSVQSLGRLRDFNKDVIPEFCYFENSAIKPHMFYRWNRLKLYKKLAKKFKTIHIY